MIPPYAQGADLAARFDIRMIGDLCEDTGTRVSPGAVPNDPNVSVSLTDAASMINAACQIGERYTQVQLAALTGADQGLLYRLNCDLAFCYLCERRGVKSPIYDEAYKRSEDLLNRLKDGALIFNVPSNVGAGLPNSEFPSAQTYGTVNLLRDSARRFFPLRPLQRPAGGN